MKRIWKRLLVLCGIFILAASAFALYTHFSEKEPEQELEYEVWGSAILPVISSEIGNQKINVLHGYTMEVDETVMEDTVMPVGVIGILPLTVACYDSTIEKASWKLTSRDGSETLAEEQVEDLAQTHDTAEITLELSSYLTADEDYRLTIVLSLSDGTEAFYYTRVRMGKELHEEEMMDFVMSFHTATFDKSAAEAYTVNLENDGTADEGTLADVTIHSTFNQLTWGDLAPTETGELTCSILELDGSFGSFCLEYQIQAEDEEGNTDVFLVTEAITIQWSETRFYLMNYHRSVTEMFNADTSRIQDGILDFGVVDSSDVQLSTSDDGGITAFAVAGELWSYETEAKKLNQIFTFQDDDDGVRSGYRRHDIQILKTEDEGDVTFLVYGYMNRGKHEGKLGVSCLQYQAEENALNEIFFLPYAGTYETLAEGISTLACMGSDSQVYLLVGDTLYSIDWEGDEVVALVDNASQRNLVINDAQTAAAWELGTGAGSVQILYLDDGTTQYMEAGEGDWISPQGFIGEDCILGLGHQSDEAVTGAQQVNPCYAVVILEREGTEAVHYEYENVYISSVTVANGQVALERLKKDSSGEFVAIDDDTLIQNLPGTDDSRTVLVSHTEDAKKRTWYLDLDCDTEDTAYDTPELVNYADSDSLNLPTVKPDDTVLRYYAFGEGRLMAVAYEAGAAIDAVYDVMGTVIDSSGRLVWYRTSRKTSVDLSVTSQAAVSGSGEALRSCLKTILNINGLSASMLDSMDMSRSSLELMEELFPGRTLDLGGCVVKALLYYVNRGCPVLIQDRYGTVLLLVGFDQYNVVYFDPTSGTTRKQGQQDAAAYLETGEFSFIGYLPET